MLTKKEKVSLFDTFCASHSSCLSCSLSLSDCRHLVGGAEIVDEAKLDEVLQRAYPYLHRAYALPKFKRGDVVHHSKALWTGRIIEVHMNKSGGWYYRAHVLLSGGGSFSPGNTAIGSEENLFKAALERKANSVPSTEAKADTGKPRISLVPTQIIRDIAAVREYGNQKYGDPENWRAVEEQRYIDALLRHTLAFMDEPHGIDAESGLPHLSHIACNVAFLCEMRRHHG